MKEVELKSVIKACQIEELSAEEQHLVNLAIEATQRSYAPYSKFHVGAAVRLENGEVVIGCNQEMRPIHRDFVPNEQPFLPLEPNILTFLSKRWRLLPVVRMVSCNMSR